MLESDPVPVLGQYARGDGRLNRRNNLARAGIEQRGGIGERKGTAEHRADREQPPGGVWEPRQPAPYPLADLPRYLAARDVSNPIGHGQRRVGAEGAGNLHREERGAVRAGQQICHASPGPGPQLIGDQTGHGLVGERPQGNARCASVGKPSDKFGDVRGGLCGTEGEYPYDGRTGKPLRQHPYREKGARVAPVDVIRCYQDALVHRAALEHRSKPIGQPQPLVGQAVQVRDVAAAQDGRIRVA